MLSLQDRLKQLRTEQGHSLRQLAELTGISPAYLSKLEQGTAQNPSIEVTEKLAAALGVTAVDLLRIPQQAELPISLRIFLRVYGPTFEELRDPDWVACLSQIKLRGRTPSQNQDWLSIFIALRGAFNRLCLS